MKKSFAVLLGLAAVMVVPSIASADEPSGPHVSVGSEQKPVVTLPVITVYGKRPAKPSMTIELTRPTAAREAGAAHEDLRKSLLEASMPAALKAAEQSRADVR